MVENDVTDPNSSHNFLKYQNFFLYKFLLLLELHLLHHLIILPTFCIRHYLSACNHCWKKLIYILLTITDMQHILLHTW